MRWMDRPKREPKRTVNSCAPFYVHKTVTGQEKAKECGKALTTVVTIDIRKRFLHSLYKEEVKYEKKKNQENRGVFIIYYIIRGMRE